MRDRRRRSLAVATAAVGLLAVAVPGSAAQDGPTVVDPFEDEPFPSAAEVAETIRDLEPEVRPLEVGEPRSLQEDVEDDEGSTTTIGSDVLFEFDSAELSERATATIRDLAAGLPDGVEDVEVIGHTDSLGTDDYNLDLSQQRADAVAEVLAQELSGVEPTTEGRGSEEPVARESEDDPGAAARNRRVEVRVTM